MQVAALRDGRVALTVEDDGSPDRDFALTMTAEDALRVADALGDVAREVRAKRRRRVAARLHRRVMRN